MPSSMKGGATKLVEMSPLHDINHVSVSEVDHRQRSCTQRTDSKMRGTRGNRENSHMRSSRAQRARVVGIRDALHVAVGVVDANRAPRREAGAGVIADPERMEAVGDLAGHVKQQHVRAAVVVQQARALPARAMYKVGSGRGLHRVGSSLPHCSKSCEERRAGVP